MLQGPAAYFSSPVYGQSHYKKFWLKKMETEDDPASMSPPPPPSSDGNGAVLKNRPPYAVSCSPLELRGTSPPSAAVRSGGAANTAERKVECAEKSELDYALALGIGVSMQEDDDDDDERAESCDEDNKFPKFVVAPAANFSVAEPSSSAGFNGGSPSPRSGAVTRMCADCKTVKTPLWRNGPQGPKSLCNACGIRYKKLGKRPLTNGGERLSPPPTPPISPSGKSVTKLNGKRKRESDDVKATKAANLRHHRKKIKALGGLERIRNVRSSMGPSGGLQLSNSSSQSEMESPGFRSEDYYSGGGGDRSGAALRRWREVERIRKGLLRYGKLRPMAKDEEEAAVLLMAISCGVASCC